MSPDECTRRLDQPIHDVGASFYFDPMTLAHGKEHVGLDGFRFYFLGRGGVLGDVPSSVVRSAFGYFEPALLDRMWTTGLERATAAGARAVAQEYLGCAYRFAEATFADLDTDPFNAPPGR